MSAEIEISDEVKAMTRHDLADTLSQVKRAIGELERKAGSDLKGINDSEIDDLKGLLDYRDELIAEQDDRKAQDDKKRDYVKGLADRIAGPTSTGSHATVRRPALAVRHQATAGSGEAEPVQDGRIDNGEAEIDKYMKKGPFKSLGHYAYEVRKAGSTPGTDSRGLMGEWNGRVSYRDSAIKGLSDDVKAATGMSEFADPDGASFVPIDISQEIWSRSMAIPNLLSLVRQIPVSGNSLSMNAWQDQDRSGGFIYGGVKAYWTDEAALIAKGKPNTRKINWKLNKMAIMAFASDELLSDSVAIDSYLSDAVAKAFAFKINEAIVSGTGVGQPLGILQSPAKITVAADAGQGANTITGKNLDNMYVRRSPLANDFIWLYNVTCEPQFSQLNYQGTGNTVAAVWTYVPGGLSGGPDRLKGRPLQETEHCPQLGTEGDLILFSPSSYGAIIKTNGLNQAVSMHLRFDYDETAFRWTFRMDGRPFWDQPLKPLNGTTRSPIITLASNRT